MANPDMGTAVRTERTAISNPVLRATMVRASDELRRIVSRLLADADEVLFDLAETSPSNTTQRRYFDGMRDIRRQSRFLVERFCAGLESGFLALAQGVPLSAPPATDDALCRVAQDSELLRQLQLRLGVLVGKTDISSECNPLDPGFIAWCLNGACQEGNLDETTVEVVEGLARDRLYGRLERLYRLLNEFLAERHVLPELVAGRTGRPQAANQPQTMATPADRSSLVSGLFEFFAHDENLPPPIRTLLDRLRAPFERVAAADPDLFDNRQHPARMLINHVARVGLKWSPEADRDETIYNELRTAVDRVVKDSSSDADAFEATFAELLGHEQQREQQAAVAEKKATEATRGRERLLLARKAATAVVSDALAQQPVPDVIAGLLSQPWANVLLLNHLRHGEGSPEWQQAVAVVDDLLWTGQPKRSAADVARLQSMLPALSQRLRSGLEMVAFQIDDIQALFEALSTLYRSLLAPEYQDRLHMPSARAAVPLRPVTHLRPVQLPAAATAARPEPAQPTPEAEPDPAVTDQIDALRIGTWFELVAADGSRVRAKLSWRSPISKKLLFVTANGTKLADKSSSELAREVAAGEAVMLDSAPIFERALGAVLGKSSAAGSKPGD